MMANTLYVALCINSNVTWAEYTRLIKSKIYFSVSIGSYSCLQSMNYDHQLSCFSYCFDIERHTCKVFCGYEADDKIFNTIHAISIPIGFLSLLFLTIRRHLICRLRLLILSNPQVLSAVRDILPIPMRAIIQRPDPFMLS